MIRKLDLIAIVAFVAGAVLWIEHGHHIDLHSPTVAAFAAPVGAVCPDSENVPYSADCIVFMQGDSGSGIRWQTGAERTPTHHAPAVSDAPGPACPQNNENVPYSARCLRFLSGWFWQAHPTERTVGTSTSAPK